MLTMISGTSGTRQLSSSIEPPRRSWCASYLRGRMLNYYDYSSLTPTVVMKATTILGGGSTTRTKGDDGMPPLLRHGVEFFLMRHHRAIGKLERCYPIKAADQGSWTFVHQVSSITAVVVVECRGEDSSSPPSLPRCSDNASLVFTFVYWWRAGLFCDKKRR